MNVLIKSATIIDSESAFHNKKQDILIENGLITQIADSIKNSNSYKEISKDNLHASQGWFDSSVCFGEPGFEERETINNGLKTAAKSGFTAVAINANTQPIIDTHSDVYFLKSKSKYSLVDLLPIGALTKNSDGNELAELFDMTSAGAVAFGDYKKSLSSSNLIKVALQYVESFNGLICSFPQEKSLTENSVMHEHITSTSIGLKGAPSIAEELQIARDLVLLEYTNGKLHIPTISTANSVELIRNAKRKKLNVSCSVAIHNLIFTDAVLSDFDTNFKVTPPLRSATDIDALITGLKDGTIDMVTSDHNPLNIELKKIEFNDASFGTIGLESAFGALNKIFSTKTAIKLLTRGKKRFGLSPQSLDIGNRANLSLFNPKGDYTFNKNHISSKSTNSIFMGSKLSGRVYGSINNNKLELT